MSLLLQQWLPTRKYHLLNRLHTDRGTGMKSNSTTQLKTSTHSLGSNGPGRELPAAGLLAACAASQAPDPEWLRCYLSRTLKAFSLTSGARNAVIEQAIEISSSPNSVVHAVEVADAYLTASSFARSQAIPLVSAVLQADVINSTAYDARAREALRRYVFALGLPFRILYTAEQELAELVHALAANATVDGENVESVGEDAAHVRRRMNRKWIKVGAAGLVGGLALGISGGLIAPALIPALSTVGLASLSAPLTALGSGGAIAVGGLFGAAGVGVGATAMASRVGDVEEFVFERCTPSAKNGSHDYDTVRISPTRNFHEALVPLPSDQPIVGGLLVWEIRTSQEFDMVVPARLAFGVLVQNARGADKASSEWILPEQYVEVGGLDSNGKGRRGRTTGAVTITEDRVYAIRFRLMPGSLTVNVLYRVAFVLPGKEPPVWVMGENEQHALEQEKGKALSLSMAILVPGLLTTEENSAYPGMCADQFKETASVLAKFDIQTFALRWESNLLLELSDALRRLVARMALSVVAQNGAMMIVPAIVGAVALPVSVIGALRTLIGNIWARTISRAVECGYMLAAEIASRSFGNRPVVLAGFSAGAVVVFTCLQELARRKLVGIVHDVYLVGAPCTADVNMWREVRTVVSGRLVNAYNPKDWYLELYHRGTNMSSVAGTRPVQDTEGIANVENICLTSEQVKNHMDYATDIEHILVDLGIADPEAKRPWGKDLQPEPDAHDACGKLDSSTIRSGILVEIGEKEDDENVVLFKRRGRRKSPNDATSPKCPENAFQNSTSDV